MNAGYVTPVDATVDDIAAELAARHIAGVDPWRVKEIAPVSDGGWVVTCWMPSERNHVLLDRTIQFRFDADGNAR